MMKTDDKSADASDGNKISLTTSEGQKVHVSDGKIDDPKLHGRVTVSLVNCEGGEAAGSRSPSKMKVSGKNSDAEQPKQGIDGNRSKNTSCDLEEVNSKDCSDSKNSDENSDTDVDVEHVEKCAAVKNSNEVSSKGCSNRKSLNESSDTDIDVEHVEECQAGKNSDGESDVDVESVSDSDDAESNAERRSGVDKKGDRKKKVRKDVIAEESEGSDVNVESVSDSDGTPAKKGDRSPAKKGDRSPAKKGDLKKKGRKEVVAEENEEKSPEKKC